MEFPIRILHAVVNMNRGGAETLIMNVYRNIDRSKIQFDFLTCKEGCFDDEIERMGGKVHRIPYMTDVGHFQFIKTLERFFSDNPEYQTVHSHMDKMSGLVLRAAQRSGIKTRICHSHNTSSEGGLFAKSYKWFAGHYILKNASHYFACSKKASAWLYGNQFNKAFILKNGIDCCQFMYSSTIEKEVRRELKISKEQFIVGHIGRFCHQKNHSLVIEIFAEIKKLKPEAILLLIGDGELRSNLEKKAEKMGLRNTIKFLGVRSDINRLLQAFNVMIFPSLHEGLPVTLVEAQAAGIPCVISDVITNEVDMGAGLIFYENIKTSPSIWAEKALKSHKGFVDSKNFIWQMGYDIRKSAVWLQDFYLKTSEA